MIDICCIGHITLDKVVNPSGQVHMPGGTSFYFSHAMANLDVRYSLVTGIAESEMHIVSELRAAGISVSALSSRHTVYFENIYDTNQDVFATLHIKVIAIVTQVDRFRVNCQT